MALAHFTVPCESRNIIESKSFKLYLNSFNNTRFADARDVRERIRADIGAAVGVGIGIKTLGPELFDREPIYELDGLSLARMRRGSSAARNSLPTEVRCNGARPPANGAHYLHA